MTTTIPFYDFESLHDGPFQEQVLNRFSKILANNAYMEGEYNLSFEKRFADLQKAKHCLLVANGTDALEIALLASGIRAGDKVGVPNITFFASAEAVVNVGATPIFIDIDPLTGLMDPESFYQLHLKYPMKAVMPVHIYGNTFEVTQIQDFCKQKDIKIVEDAAQAQGGFYKSGPVGSAGNLTTFSFYPTKNLSAFGDAGAILFESDDLKQTILQIRNHGRGPGGHLRVGRNSRCDHMQAAVLDLKLNDIEQINEKRRQVASWYYKRLDSSAATLLPTEAIKRSSWHLFPILLPNEIEKFALAEKLNELGIATNPYFYASTMQCIKPLSQYPGENQQALKFCKRVICLPLNPFMSENNVDAVCNHLQELANLS